MILTFVRSFARSFSPVNAVAFDLIIRLSAARERLIETPRECAFARSLARRHPEPLFHPLSAGALQRHVLSLVQPKERKRNRGTTAAAPGIDLQVSE